MDQGPESPQHVLSPPSQLPPSLRLQAVSFGGSQKAAGILRATLTQQPIYSGETAAPRGRGLAQGTAENQSKAEPWSLGFSPPHLSQTHRCSAPGARRAKPPGLCRTPRLPCGHRTPSGMPGGLHRGSAGVPRTSPASLRSRGVQRELVGHPGLTWEPADALGRGLSRQGWGWRGHSLRLHWGVRDGVVAAGLSSSLRGTGAVLRQGPGKGLGAQPGE